MAARSNGRQVKWPPDYESLQPSFKRVTDSGKYKGGHDDMLLTDAVCCVIGASRPLKVFPQGTDVQLGSVRPGPANRL